MKGKVCFRSSRSRSKISNIDSSEGRDRPLSDPQARQSYLEHINMLNSLIYMGFRYNPHLYNHSPLDPRMNIKKLIASVVIALGAWMSVGVAQAQTNYDFSMDFSIGLRGGTHYIIDGTATSSGTTLSNPVFTFLRGDATALGGNTYAITNSSYSGSFVNITSTTPVGTFGGLNYFQPIGLPTGTFTFTANGINYTGSNVGMYANNSIIRETLSGSGIAYSSSPAVSNTQLGSIGITAPVGGSGVAPEMNASFIPQVALMLACLFFLFGRKKENTEVMLAA